MRQAVFTIRKQHMDAFSRSVDDAFIQRLVRHLRDNFPGQVADRGLGPKDLEPLARRGLANARKYGLVAERDIRMYVELMVLLGPNFDEDPKLPWAGASAHASSVSRPSMRGC